MLTANSRVSSLQSRANAGLEPNAQTIQNKNSVCKVAAVALGALILGLAVGSSLALFAHVGMPIACIAGASSTALFISAYALYNFFKKPLPAPQAPKLKSEILLKDPGMLQDLHLDARNSILAYLSLRELARCSQLNKDFNRYGRLLPEGKRLSSSSLPSRIENAFFTRLLKEVLLREVMVGREEWQKQLSVDIGEVPELPDALCRELFLPDPLSPEKPIFQTHMVIAIPEKYTKADGTDELLTFSNYGKLIAHKFPERWPPAAPVDPAVAIPAGEAPVAADEKRGYYYFWGDAWQEHKDKGTGEKTYWLLIKTDKILPDTAMKTYPKRETVVTAYNVRNQKSMEISSALPTIIAFTMQFFRTGQFPPICYACCKETSGNHNWHLTVGGSASRGPDVDLDYLHGVVLSRKF